MTVVDLSCDLGESYGNFKVGSDEEVIPHIASASVGCGFHAGDPSTMRKTIELAKGHKVRVGAHPGFPDLLGFGRRNLDVSSRDITTLGGTPEAAIERVVVALETGRLRTSSGRMIDWTANSVCFHGDSKDTLVYARGLRSGIEEAGIEVRAPADWGAASKTSTS